MMPRRDFGSSWWVGAWLDALEQRASLDPNRLPRGRTYARQDRTTELDLAPGVMRARVQGSRRSPYRVEVAFRQFDQDEWDRVFDAVAAKAGHAAALLDGELDPAVVEDARAVGVELLPDAGDLRPLCSCPDWANPCKHSAAVCYLVARELDRDPFVLLLLRGRNRNEILSELRRRRSRSQRRKRATTVPPEKDRSIRAGDAWRRIPGDLPIPPAPPTHPGSPAVLAADPPSTASFTAEGLGLLVADAAERAWKAHRGEDTLGLAHDHDIDLVRRAASALGTPVWTRLVEASGEDGRRLARRAAAWIHGGVAGVHMADEPRWQADRRLMAMARHSLIEAGAPSSRVRVRLNTITVGDVQIRLATTGRWWRFARRSGAWELDSPPADEPDDLWE